MSQIYQIIIVREEYASLYTKLVIYKYKFNEMLKYVVLIYKSAAGFGP